MQTLHKSNSQSPTWEALSERSMRWRKTVEAELKGAPFDKKLVTRTLEGIALQPLYTRANLAELPSLQSVPGQAPFLRGAHAGGYRARPWEIAQEISETSAADFNAALSADLMAGQNAVIIDSPELLADLATLRRALAGVNLTAVPVRLSAGANALPVAALYLNLATEKRHDWTKLTGGIVADPLAAWATTGSLVHGLKRELDALAGWTRWAANHAPQLYTIGVNGRMWGDAGATAVQELAFALASGAEYLRAAHERGVGSEAAARRMQFTFSVGPQFFTEIAKFRAWRLLWTRVVSAYGNAPEIATFARVHVATTRWNKTLLDPHVNLLRVTTEALSAVLGGCDSLHVSPYDEITGVTDDFSRRIARNLHSLLAEEFGFASTSDAAGGSWYVETLTDELAGKAWELFQEIAGLGGFAEALRDGLPQRLVAEAAGEKTDGVGKRRLPLVGTNLFPNLREKPLTLNRTTAIPSPAPAVELPKVASKAPWPEHFEAALAAAKAGASSKQLSVLAAAKARRHDVIATIAPCRAAAGFEQIRAAADAIYQDTGKRPRVFLAKIGPAIQHKARSDFSAGFFATGGFEVLAKQTFENGTAAGEAAAASGAPIAVLCSTDETYPALVPAFAAAAKANRPGLKLVLAGLPADAAAVEAYRRAGIDEFIHLRANACAVLATFLTEIGVLV